MDGNCRKKCVKSPYTSAPRERKRGQKQSRSLFPEPPFHVPVAVFICCSSGPSPLPVLVISPAEENAGISDVRQSCFNPISLANCWDGSHGAAWRWPRVSTEGGRADAERSEQTRRPTPWLTSTVASRSLVKRGNKVGYHRSQK
ncbi:hypothetical protein AAFF_G00123450 [Aldrovandia affinis]|uniref:Uncharacterized protein n=1 Tax=Aldrovandia affinis TaxID=143900 RepID=A0AAD7RRP9_9TELE|nr:hypothetical protein AAFF_G00123450 [Aldrovandia affinis]